MKNTIADLNNYLFEELERITDESLDDPQREKALARAKKVGVDTVVFGSGASRKIQDGFSREKAVEQLELVCRKYLDPIAAKNGITIVIEPLNKTETNIFNSVEEAMIFVNKLSLANVKCLADTYHMDLESEPYSNVRLAGNALRHAHIANPDGRVMPLAGDKNDYVPFMKYLREINYFGRLSVEAGVPEGMTLKNALCETVQFLKSIV